jgi:outer membrane protein OmpA-like peptidoglycan-associated protein/Mg-chelatase subunit ChlD
MRQAQWIRTIAFMAAAFFAAGAFAAADVEIATPGRASRLTVEPMEGPQQLLVSALGEDGEPIRGLGAADFAASRGIRRAKILSAVPLETRQDMPLNIVLVIDNSLSMRDRKAVEPLLAALEDLLHDIRPIDNVHAVVFNDKQKQWVGGLALNTLSYSSRNAADWKRFFADAFDRGLSKRTYLYEGILAGLEILKRMPAEAAKAMVVFSDGEDLNSKVDRAEVAAAGRDLRRFQAFGVDYMPEEKTDEFLAGFAAERNGRVWKARAAYELGPIFQAFKSTLLHRYVLTYELLNPITLEPPALGFEILTTTSGDPAGPAVFFAAGQSAIPPEYTVFADRSQAEGFSPEALTGALERHFHVLNIVGHSMRRAPESRVGIAGCSSGPGAEAENLDLARRRAEAVKAYLETVWGIAADRLLLEARGLPSRPASPDAAGGPAENQRVEFLFESDRAASEAAGLLIAESRGRREALIRLDLNPMTEVRRWEIVVRGEDQPLKTLSGTGAVPDLHRVALDELGRERLARLNAIEALVRLTDGQGTVHEAASDLCHIKSAPRGLIGEIAFPPQGRVDLAPDTVTVEEITVVDSAPLLNFIYFETGKADIPERYRLYADANAARAFDAGALRETMEKYQNVLNIIGQRASERPGARLKITGCHSGAGEEKGRLELSKRRAESVARYLQAAWGIDARRLEIEARGLPALASSPDHPEGRAENQRVEITSDDAAILDTARSSYIQTASDTEALRIAPVIESGLPLKSWRIEVQGDGKPLESLSGEGPPAPRYVLALKDIGLRDVGAYRSLTAVVEASDAKGRGFRAEGSSGVRRIRREERLASREGHKVVEKYALILFDFDRAEIRERNRAVLERIVGRIRELPDARVRIFGHTDTIGKPDYNVALSRRRAQAAADQILAGVTPEKGNKVAFEGKGPSEPLFDNSLPEGRAYNRTVTVTLEYAERP